MKVRAVDCLPSFGKTKACYTMVNESKDDERFIFITPYLDEVVEMIKECPEKHFKQPARTPSEDGNVWSKLNGLHKLLEDGENIASTHALFTIYNEQTVELIKKHKFTLIIDETVEVFQQVGKFKAGDIDMIIRNSIASTDIDGKVAWNDSEYSDGSFIEIKELAMAGNLYLIGKQFYKYLLKKDVLMSFNNIFVLTYLFEHQPIRSFLEMNNIEYETLGVKIENGTYRFCAMAETDRRRDLRDRITIVDNDKLNAVGNGYSSLSSSWFEERTKKPKDYDVDEKVQKKYKESKHPDIVQLRNNAVNFFVNHYPSPMDERMWSCVKRFEKDLQKKGYMTAFVPYNQRAVEDHVGKKYLVYCTNIFTNPVLSNYFESRGARPINEGWYALAILTQWVFRSALRRLDGGNIVIFLPSQRMRYLFSKWLDKLAVGEDLEEIQECEVRRICATKKEKNKINKLEENLRNVKRSIGKKQKGGKI